MFSLIGFMALFAIIYFVLKKVKSEKIFFLISWIMIFLIFASLTSHKEDRYIMQIAPAIALISAAAIYYFENFKKTLFIVLIAVSFISTYSYYIHMHEISNNINSECFLQVVNYIEKIDGEYLIVSENPPIFRYYVKKESSYYPYPLNEESMHEIQKEDKTYFLFTRLNSGMKEEEWKSLKEILEKNYKLEFECPLDKERNFIYSNN